MDGGWQPVLSNLTSDSCLSSDVFSASNVPNGTAYCAYRVPSIQHAQICCLSKVTKDPQDDCTYICAHQTSFPILSCLHTVLGSLNPHWQRPTVPQTFSTSLSGKAVQMLCFDHEGNALPNISYPSANLSSDSRPQSHSPLFLSMNGSQEDAAQSSRSNTGNSLQQANTATSSALKQTEVSIALRSWSIWLMPLAFVSLQILSNG